MYGMLWCAEARSGSHGRARLVTLWTGSELYVPVWQSRFDAVSSVKVGHGAERLVQARIGSHGYAWWCTSGKARSGVAVVVLCVASGCGWSDEERYGSPGTSG